MANFLFSVIITPLSNILEFFFTLFFEITNNKGLAVIGLSLVVTLLTLPLYMTAEKWQEAERDVQEKLKPGIQRIKKAFKGDEQYMILSTYYRQNHYHPLMALRSSFSLLIQIPFFIAAYTFLSHLEALKGVSFLFIQDFGQPDSLFKIGSFSVNILPIAMTLINCISGALYSKGHGINEKIQIYGCAAVFLVLLYNSPSGLVVYWTMNNVFSLVKNIFYKLKNPRRILYILICVVAVIILASDLLILKKTKVAFRLLAAVFAVVLPLLPLATHSLSSLLGSSLRELDKNRRLRLSLFAFSAVMLALLAGLTIPSMLMESEPIQYCFVEDYTSPFVFLSTAFFQALGLFVFWPSCLYALFSTKIKKAFAILFPILAFISLLNTFLFSGKYGPILPECVFMQTQNFIPSPFSLAINVLSIATVIMVLVIAVRKKTRTVCYCSVFIAIALTILSVKNIAEISSAYKRMTPPEIKTEIEPAYHLSKNGRNVILIMQDRLFSPFIEPCLDEKPMLREALDGFVFYKNTVSFGHLTMIGAPGIYGGYSFTPYEINKRTDETLQEKHNQALLTLPIVFHDAGFNVTVSGLPYENYLEYPIEAMYEGYEYIERAETRGAYSDLWYLQHGVDKVKFLAKDIKRNIIWFSIFKMVPPVMRMLVYYKGSYWSSYSSYDDGIPRFIDNYSELDYLPELTVADSDNDSFIILDNELVHESILLNYPDYIPSTKNVTEFGNGPYSDNDHYTTMMATFNMYEKFFEHLKKLGVYDNTRIIIVSDHGAGIKVPEFEQGGGWRQSTVASLLVKDFGKRGQLETDMTFMTNADSPYIATKDIIENAKNPFTSLPFKIDDKQKYIKIMIAPGQSTRTRKETKFHVKSDEWLTVHDNIFVPENWSQYKEE